MFNREWKPTKRSVRGARAGRIAYRKKLNCSNKPWPVLKNEVTYMTSLHLTSQSD